jgi:hypothetical protein
MSVNLQQEAVTANIVPEAKRLSFLPELFGAHLMRGEHLVYMWMDRLCEAYNGGYWEYVKLSNGGGYMSPRREGRMHIFVDGNQFDREMSTDAAGIVATMFALCQLANERQDEAIINRYYALRMFALDHPEAHLIFRAID